MLRFLTYAPRVVRVKAGFREIALCDQAVRHADNIWHPLLGVLFSVVPPVLFPVFPYFRGVNPPPMSEHYYVMDLLFR